MPTASYQSARRKKLSPQCAVPVAGAASMSLNPPIAFRHEIGGAIRGSRSAVTARAHGSTGRERPGSLPHSGDLWARGVVLVEGWGQAPPPSDKDARWHDRAPAERHRDRRRAVANRSPAVPQQSAPTRPWQMDFSLRPAPTSELRLSQSHAGRASTETTQH